MGGRTREVVVVVVVVVVVAYIMHPVGAHLGARVRLSSEAPVGQFPGSVDNNWS